MSFDFHLCFAFYPQTSQDAHQNRLSGRSPLLSEKGCRGLPHRKQVSLGEFESFILTGSPTEIRLFYKRDYTNSQNISKNLQEQNTNNHTKKH